MPLGALNATQLSLPNTTGKLPDVPKKGRYLVQNSTNRIYAYSDGAARRNDMALYVDGKQVPNLLLGQNKQRPAEPDDLDASYVNPEMQEKFDAMQNEIASLKALVEKLAK